MFLLREVFDYEYAEIAQITGRGETACRQLFSRAKSTSGNIVRAFLPRRKRAKMVGQFMQACMAGDIETA